MLLTSATLFLSGCTIDSYLTDPNGVQCDGKRTMAELGKDLGQISFFAHEEGTDTVKVTVTREGENKYAFSAEPAVIDPKDAVHVVGDVVQDGSANPDFSFAHGDAIWGVDVRPDEASAVISGNC